MSLNFKPTYFEVAFGPKVGARRNSDRELSINDPIELGRVKIQGKIDRIDVANNEFIVYDYKTGSGYVNQEQIEKGIHLQIPLYIKIAEEIFKLKERELEGIGGYNYIVRRDVKSKAVLIQEKIRRSRESNYFNKEIFKQKIDEAVGKANQFVDGIIEGKFNLTEHDESLQSICGNCPYIEICRINEVNFGVQIKSWGYEMKGRVLFDIETSGFPIDVFDDVQYEYLMKFAEEEESEEKREKERAKVIERLNLYPLTAQVVAIGMLNVDSSQGVVLYQANEKEEWEYEIDKVINVFASDESRKDKVKIKFISGSEAEIIQKFWGYISKFKTFITFNGRGFDCPFLMLRSAILGIKPSRDLMEYNRTKREPHIDLLEEFTFFGLTRKFSLDFYCKVFNIESPKSHGITGHDINQLFNEGRFKEIAQYCMYDIIAEAELFFRWEQFLNPKNIGNTKGL